ncbi:hypothetical protein FB451DRAFT_1397873 [Mycena latifolia]|nr:hypothetical protein FB451DRAFT_1397873 [Mycena latifolia]
MRVSFLLVHRLERANGAQEENASHCCVPCPVAVPTAPAVPFSTPDAVSASNARSSAVRLDTLPCHGHIDIHVLPLTGSSSTIGCAESCARRVILVLHEFRLTPRTRSALRSSHALPPSRRSCPRARTLPRRARPPPALLLDTPLRTGWRAHSPRTLEGATAMSLLRPSSSSLSALYFSALLVHPPPLCTFTIALPLLRLHESRVCILVRV